jgi:type IV pilus assembly protein PilV
MRAWVLSLKETIGPSACGRINCLADSCLVDVQWDDSRGSGDQDDLAEYTVQTRSTL